MQCYRCASWPCECRDGQTLIHGDCRELLPELPPVDLVLTDPPYGISDKPNQQQDATGRRPTGRKGFVNTWHPESTWDHELILPQLEADVIAWFGHWRKREQVEQHFGPTHGHIRCEIIWAKDTHVGPPCPAAMQDERIWVFARGKFKPRKFETTIWAEPIIPTWAHRHHRNEKPLSLIKRALLWLPGESILDPFAGSGTTLRAAKDLGRKAIGIELDERHCETAAERLRQEVLF